MKTKIIPIVIILITSMFIVPINYFRTFLTPYGVVHLDFYKTKFNNTTSVMIIINGNGTSFYYNGIYGRSENKYILTYFEIDNKSFVVTKCPFVPI